MGRKAREAAKCKLLPHAPRDLADVPLAPELLADWGCVAVEGMPLRRGERLTRHAQGHHGRRAWASRARWHARAEAAGACA
jgi:hypothetical protein